MPHPEIPFVRQIKSPIGSNEKSAQLQTMIMLKPTW